jgi:hypothetical protein
MLRPAIVIVRSFVLFGAFAVAGCGGGGPAPGGSTPAGGACTSSTTEVCMGSCQVCLLPKTDGGIDFEHGMCAELCTNPGGTCANGKTCKLLHAIQNTDLEYNDSGACDPDKTAVCV